MGLADAMEYLKSFCFVSCLKFYCCLGVFDSGKLKSLVLKKQRHFEQPLTPNGIVEDVRQFVSVCGSYMFGFWSISPQ